MIRGIDLPQEKKFSQSSICAARQKLSSDIFRDLNDTLISKFAGDVNMLSEDSLLTDHRVFAVDGSKINLPKELEEEFGLALHQFQFHFFESPYLYQLFFEELLEEDQNNVFYP